MKRPRLAVWKFASCDGCQLTLLDCEDELLSITQKIDIAYFLEATSAPLAGRFDVSLVEGSITTPEDARRIADVRRRSDTLITIGACATSGGIQALRNFADLPDYLSAVYAQPQFISTLERSTPISDHVPVDLELRGCPIDKHQLIDVVDAYLHGRKPTIARHSLCEDCKRRGVVCVTVANGVPCLGPVTQTGCGALCPRVGRGCYGCFGPAESPNVEALTRLLADHGVRGEEAVRLYRTFNAATPVFIRGSEVAGATMST